MMSEQEQKLVELAEKHEAIVEQLKANAEELEAALTALGIGHMFQADDGTVYKIHQPKGGYTYYKHIDYKRTNREGERSGDALSKKEAKEMGFEV
jgi:hypothetical protein